MPKEETKKASGKRVANLLILTNGRKSIIVASPQSYEVRGCDIPNTLVY